MVGLIFLSVLLANIIFLFVLFIVCYFIYKKNKNYINKVLTNIQIKYDEILYNLKESVLLEKTIIDKIVRFESKIENIDNTIYDFKENMRK